MAQLLQHILRLPVLLYRLVISPLKPSCCRFTPTCSEYALDAIKMHGIKGLWLAIKRIARCHPWSEQAFDPVPQKGAQNQSLSSPSKETRKHAQ